MKYIGTVIAVRDVKASRAFYEELFGLELYQDYGINVSFTCGLSLQQEFHWLVGISLEQVMVKSRNMELYFEEEDFDAFLERLAQYPGVQYHGDVVEQSWGQRVVRIEDPDGHLIEIGEQMKTVIRRFQEAGMTMEEISKRMDVPLGDLAVLLKE